MSSKFQLCVFEYGMIPFMFTLGYDDLAGTAAWSDL